MASKVDSQIEAIRKRLKKSPHLAQPSKGDKCLICGKYWYTCPHSVKDVFAVANYCRVLDLIGE